MRFFALPISFAVALVGLQLLSTQPVEAKGRQHHMRDRYARQQAFFANPGAYRGYGASCNMPMNSSVSPANLPAGIARQVYGNAYGNQYGNAYGNYGNNNRYGFRNRGFLRGLLGY